MGDLESEADEIFISMKRHTAFNVYGKAVIMWMVVTNWYCISCNTSSSVNNSSISYTTSSGASGNNCSDKQWQQQKTLTTLTLTTVIPLYMYIYYSRYVLYILQTSSKDNLHAVSDIFLMSAFWCHEIFHSYKRYASMFLCFRKFKYENLELEKVLPWGCHSMCDLSTVISTSSITIKY